MEVIFLQRYFAGLGLESKELQSVKCSKSFHIFDMRQSIRGSDGCLEAGGGGCHKEPLGRPGCFLGEHTGRFPYCPGGGKGWWGAVLGFTSARFLRLPASWGEVGPSPLVEFSGELSLGLQAPSASVLGPDDDI